MTKPLRLVIALGVLLFPALLGWHYRNPALIPIVGALYVPLYFLGKMGAWQAIGYAPTRSAILRSLPITFAIQSVLAGAFYLIGLGLGALFGDASSVAALDTQDAIWVAVFLVATLPVTAYIAYGERHVAQPSAHRENGQTPTAIEEDKDLSTPNDDIVTGDGDEFGIYTRSVTPETFYNGQHFSCLLYTSPSPRDRTRSRMPSSA